MSKLFRGSELSDTALLAREAIQNSSDAARRFAKEHDEIPFRMVFRFEHLFGDEKAAAVESLNLGGMQEHRISYDVDPLQPGSNLDQLDNPAVPLSLLYVEDYGTHGLYGDPRTFMNSHLFMAMYYIGASDKAADEGGSYGFGKSALERASRTHSVLAYSVFEPRDNDSVCSRLVGFTWWQNLQVGDGMHSGRGQFASDTGEDAQHPDYAPPFEDGEADAVAEGLGFASRDKANLGELGTSFLIVDPAIDPLELVQEIERWWWPALEEHLLDVKVILPSGEAVVPKPARNAFVAQFLRPYRIATLIDSPSDLNTERLASKDWRDMGQGGKDLGGLGLVSPDAAIDQNGDPTDTSTLIALMRSPRMVIRYSEFSQRRKALRGVFVASEKANVLLRETEPSSHDRWTSHSAGDVPQRATETASAVMTKIANSVSKMAKEIAPPPPKANASLALFSKLMNGFFGTKRGPGKPPSGGGEPIELQFPKGRPSPEIVDDNDVRVRSVVAVRVAEGAPGEACQVRVACHLFIYEDDNRSRTHWPVALTPVGEDHSFTREDDGSWLGTITRREGVEFVCTSNPYPNIWTTSLQPTVTRIGDWSAE